MLDRPRQNDKWFKLIVFFIWIPLINGCWSHRDLEQLSIVAGAGVDYGKNGQILLTPQIIIPSAIKSGEGGSTGGGGGGGVSGTPSVRVGTVSGDTVFQAVRNFLPQASRKLYFPHMQILVIGEETAKKGIYPFIDFFARDPEGRPGIRVIVAEGNASEIMRSQDGLEPIPALGIARSIQASADNGFTSDVTLQNLLDQLMSKTTAPVLPQISIYQETGFENKKTQRIRTVGVAVFKGDKMIGKMGPTDTRGLMWVLGKIKNAVISFETSGITGSFEVTRASSQITPELSKGELQIKINIKVEGNIGGQEGFSNLAALEAMSRNEKQISSQIKKEAAGALKKAQEFNADIFMVGEAVHRKYPGEWKTIENHWNEIFPRIKFLVSVQTVIHELGMINKPVFQGR